MESDEGGGGGVESGRRGVIRWGRIMIERELGTQDHVCATPVNTYNVYILYIYINNYLRSPRLPVAPLRHTWKKKNTIRKFRSVQSHAQYLLTAIPEII